MEGFRLAKSISTLKPCRVCILPAKEETEGSNPPKLKEAAVKAWKSITKEECKSLVMSRGHRLDAVIESKGFATKYQVFFTLIYVNYICSNTFAHMKNGWVQTKVLSSKLFIRSRYEYLEIKAYLLSHIHLLISNPNVFSLHQK